MTGMTRDEFLAAVEALDKTPDRGAEAKRLRDFSIQAQVVAERLTADPNWNTYLAYLQEKLERVEEGILAVEARLIGAGPELLDATAYAALKVQWSWLDGIRKGLEWASALPKEIIENGKAASRLEIGDDNSGGGPG